MNILFDLQISRRQTILLISLELVILYLMYTISFFDVSLSQASKYVMILRTGTETKRTNICQQWTSSPTFDSLVFDDISTLTLQVCEATVDRKLRIIGAFEIKQVQLDVSSEMKIGQTIEGQFLCVGKCIVNISKVTQGKESHLSGAEEEDLQLKEKLDENEDSQVRLHFYCGLRFFLNSVFHVEVKWGAKNGRTRGIKDKINPVWGDSILLKGDISSEVQIRVRDGKQNILEYAHFSLKPLRILHPYHIKMLFRQEYLGDRPEIYFTVVREDQPHFTILQKPIKFKARSLSTDSSSYAIVSKQGLFPRFNDVDMQSKYSFQNINDSQSVELIPLSEKESQFSLFKSLLAQKLVCAVVSAEARVFEGGTECRTIHVERDFEKALRDVYYHERTFSIKQLLEVSNPNSMHDNQKEDSLRSQWKILSKNYTLRTQLLNQSIANIAHAKKSIEEKGKELIQLKKILREVKKNGVELKERTQIQIIQQKQRYDVNAWKMREIVDELFAKQEQLAKTRRLNDELRSRMAVLEQVTDNVEQVDFQIVNNSKIIQQQQGKIQTMLAIRKALPQQREILSKLEGIFEQRHEDKQMNLLLQEQQRKLARIREYKKGSLEAVYNLVKEKTKPALKQKIIQAESTLARLNKEYALLHS